MRKLLLVLLLLICGCDEKPVAPKATLYAFQATWCVPCHRMNPVLDSLKGYRIFRIDVDERPRLAEKYHVQSLPTFIAIRNGREVGRVVGESSKAELLRLLQ